ncbi:MAG: hypothetical protein H6707_06385 [Deltaproteobacteria bacterium]|nr:hypothetical protein [Deltaproteobacteria bacterium]
MRRLNQLFCLLGFWASTTASLFASAAKPDAGQSIAAEPARRAPAARPMSTDKSWIGPIGVKRGLFDRPYLARLGSAVAIGGYIDMLGAFKQDQGISEGWSFEARRFNIFVSSAIADFVRLTSELEFEHGTEEIALETALVDLLLFHGLNLRGGILLVPIGRFNLSHDSPIYDLIDRPLVSTQIIPSTFSDVGAGLFGSFRLGRKHRIGYELYLLNGLGDGLLSTEGTRLSAGRNPTRFESDNNGSPALSGRVTYSTPLGLEVAASFYTGIYNTFRRDGQTIAAKQWATIIALDAEYERGPLVLRGEAAFAHIDVPEELVELFARRQFGLYFEGTLRVAKGALSVFDEAALYLASRIDYVDLNARRRHATGELVGEETTRLSVALSFRPVPGTSFRLVYHHSWLNDPLNNASRSAALQLGLATYF